MNELDNSAVVDITSETVFGSRHALETLLQLTTISELHETSRAIAKGLVMVAQASIQDKPTYTHRGLLIDTARNYLPLGTIRRQLDAMGASKLNVLHWHLTDSQSFPFESKRVPQLSKYGAYSSGEVYRSEELKEIVKYGKLRGVRIIYELDAPSHVGSGWQWGKSAGLGNLVLCYARQPWRSFCIQPPCGQFNPVNEHVYRLLEDLYKDILELAPEEVIHMGGDELYIPCWNSSEEVLNYLRQNLQPLTTESFLDLWGLFQSKAMAAWDTAAGTTTTPVMLWTSALTEPAIIEKYLPNSRFVTVNSLISHDHK